MSQFPNSLPGIGPGSLTLTPRMLFIMDTNAGDFLPSGRIIDGTQTRDPGNTPVTEIRPGLILGKISATTSGAATLPTIGEYAASVIDTLGVVITDTTNTAITLSSTAGATELVRRIGSAGTLVLTGPPAAAGTVASSVLVYTAVNTSTKVVTLSGAINVAFVAGSYIGANDGSYVPFTVFSGNVTPLRVTDINGTSMHVPLPLISITNKPYFTDNIVNYPSDSSLKTYLKTKIRVAVPGAAFSDDF